MRFQIQSAPGGGCAIRKVEFHNTTELPVPIGAADLTAAMSALLADPDKREVEDGPVQIVKTADGVSIRTAQGQVTIGWQHLWSIEGIPA